MNKCVINIGFLLASSSFSAFAQAPSVVDSSQCMAVKGSNKPFILALRKDEAVQAAITNCANDAQLNAATLSGLGAFSPVTLRYFDHEKKAYSDKLINDFMEVTNLTGNITFVNGVRQNHIHVTLSDKNFRPQAGHLKDAVVGAVLEVQVTPLEHKISKHFDEKTGLEIMTTKK